MGMKPRPVMQLGTKNFSADEFRCRDGSAVPVQFYASTQLLMLQLEALREELQAPIRITSGYRSPEYNASIGGAKHSKHMLGQAADIKVAGYPPKVVADTIERLIHEGRMVEGGLGRYKNFTHFDVRGRRARWGSDG